jgi:hypothetical protein
LDISFLYWQLIDIFFQYLNKKDYNVLKLTLLDVPAPAAAGESIAILIISFL